MSYPQIQLSVPSGSGSHSILTWPTVPGKSYRVQFETNLTDATWQYLNGSATILGNQGRATDFSPAPQRFYWLLYIAIKYPPPVETSPGRAGDSVFRVLQAKCHGAR